MEASFKILFDSVHRTFIARVDPQIRSLVHAPAVTPLIQAATNCREICIGILYCLHSMNPRWLVAVSFDKVTHHLSRWRGPLIHCVNRLLLKWNPDAHVSRAKGRNQGTLLRCNGIITVCSFTELLFEWNETFTPELVDVEIMLQCWLLYLPKCCAIRGSFLLRGPKVFFNKLSKYKKKTIFISYKLHLNDFFIVFFFFFFFK